MIDIKIIGHNEGDMKILFSIVANVFDRPIREHEMTISKNLYSVGTDSNPQAYTKLQLNKGIAELVFLESNLGSPSLGKDTFEPSFFLEYAESKFILYAGTNYKDEPTRVVGADRVQGNVIGAINKNATARQIMEIINTPETINWLVENGVTQLTEIKDTFGEEYKSQEKGINRPR
jgi:hypothetical protein